MNLRALAAEFVGTLALIFIGVSAIAANFVSGGALGLTGIALAHGLTIAVMVTVTAAVSGGHLNPAVSFGLFCAGKFPARSLLPYIVAQCLGALVAVLAVQCVYSADALNGIRMGTPLPGTGVLPYQAFTAEVVLTFFLVAAVLGTAVHAKAPKMGGLFIGLTVALDIMAGGPVSGGAMNPARHFGPALLGGGTEFLWLYWAAPLLGGAIAGLFYRTVLKPSEG